MKKRSIAAVLLLPFVTFGIYGIYWYVSTKGEMNSLGAKIPTSWLLIVPFVNIWWLWKYSEGVEQVTNGKTSAILAFLLMWFLSWPGQGILQASFNEVTGAVAAAPAAYETPVAPTPPAPTTPSTPTV